MNRRFPCVLFAERPNMVGQSRGHGGRTRVPMAIGHPDAECSHWPAEIVGVHREIGRRLLKSLTSLSVFAAVRLPGTTLTTKRCSGSKATWSQLSPCWSSSGSSGSQCFSLLADERPLLVELDLSCLGREMPPTRRAGAWRAPRQACCSELPYRALFGP